MADTYYEVILPEHAGRPIIIQEFDNAIGVAYLHFGEEVIEEVKKLGGHEEGAHYGPDSLTEHYCSVAQGSWIFPKNCLQAVIDLTHRVIGQVEEKQKKRGRPAKDKISMAFTLDRAVGEIIQDIPEGERSEEVNKVLRKHFLSKEYKLGYAAYERSLNAGFATEKFLAQAGTIIWQFVETYNAAAQVEGVPDLVGSKVKDVNVRKKGFRRIADQTIVNMLIERYESRSPDR